MTPLQDFPFVEETGSLAGAVACMLDQIVRPLIRGPQPLFVIDAPAFGGQGTGKTLLADVCGVVATGKKVGPTPWPSTRREDEMQKIIAGLLRGGYKYVLFDNIAGTVESDTLAAVATNTTWTPRILGSNDLPTLPQTATFVLTLNGARFNRDLARRASLLQLDAGTRDPNTRQSFRIPNLIAWVEDHRAALIHAALTIARAWVCAGRPRDPKVKLASFESWAHTVGGILKYAGIDGLDKTLDSAKERDDRSSSTTDFVTVWRQAFPSTPVIVRALVGLCDQRELLLDELTSSTPRGNMKHLNSVLDSLVGHTFDGWTVGRRKTRIDGMKQYIVTDNPAAWSLAFAFSTNVVPIRSKKG